MFAMNVLKQKEELGVEPQLLGPPPQRCAEADLAKGTEDPQGTGLRAGAPPHLAQHQAGTVAAPRQEG